jgi:enediyne biosynthesis protein E4
LLLNQGTADNHWIDVALQDPSTNRFGFGARVGIERAGKPTLWRRLHSDGSYLSASDFRVHAGLGSSTAIDGLVVQWGDGTRERWAKVDADRLLTLKRGTGQTEKR